jgi:hypothetical protein
LDFLRRIGPYQGLAPTPTAFFSVRADFRLERGRGPHWCCPFARVHGHSFLLHFAPPAALATEGLAPFFEIADAWRRLSDLSAAEPDERAKGNPESASQRPENREKDRPIDPTFGTNASA